MTAAMDAPTRLLKGIPAAPGLAAGPPFVLEEERLEAPRREGQDPAAEQARLNEAVRAIQASLEALRERIESEASSQEAAIFEAHAMMLLDPALHGRARKAMEGGLNAEAAWMEAVEFFADQLAALPDPTLSARAADVRDVGRRVLRMLLGLGEAATPKLAEPSVILARDLAPSQTAGMERGKVLAFCTAEGGPTSHTAILARALGLPAVVGLGPAILQGPFGRQILVDGDTGEVTFCPDDDACQSFEVRMQGAHRRALEERQAAGQPVVTSDGRAIEIVANVGSPEDAAGAVEFGAEGIGLLRTEFLYLDRRTAPGEDEQVEAYRRILEPMGGRPVVARTLDVGGDKPLPYLDLGHEANPFLGWRGLRMCLERPEVFLVQLRALLRAGAGHDLRIMFPMVATLEEVQRARAMLDQARQQLRQDGLEAAESPQVGIMVEVPSAAVLADRLAPHVDFFSIGTNDLTQYTLAAERTNDRVAHLTDALHPSVLRLIRQVVEAAHAHGRWAGVCGELAGDPAGAVVLLGLGIDELSMAAPLIPRVKSVLRRWSAAGARRLAEQALDQDSAAAVRALVRKAKPA